MKKARENLEACEAQDVGAFLELFLFVTRSGPRHCEKELRATETEPTSSVIALQKGWQALVRTGRPGS